LSIVDSEKILNYQGVIPSNRNKNSKFQLSSEEYNHYISESNLP